MDGKLLARIGAAVFVGIAIAMTLVQLREGPKVPEAVVPAAPVDGVDRLKVQLRACTRMGEEALSSPECHAAWAEKRRRFFGVEHPDAFIELEPAPSPSARVEN